MSGFPVLISVVCIHSVIIMPSYNLHYINSVCVPMHAKAEKLKPVGLIPS